jgi:hypothetical protein
MDPDASNSVSEIWATLRRHAGQQKHFILRKTFGTTQIHERHAPLAGGLS